MIEYDREAAKALTASLAAHGGMVFEGHSTDYQPRKCLRQMVEDGIAILKVGPALTFALRHPDRVEKLILNGANLNPKGVKWTVQAPIVLGYRIACLFGQKAKQNAEMLGLMVKEPNFVPDDLKDLHIPTLVIAGDHDMIRNSHTRQITASLPNAELAILPGDHFVANRSPVDFNRAVYGFLCKYVNRGTK